MKTRALHPVFVEYVPAVLEQETLYVSMQYETAVHLCACGCGARVVTPLGASDWILTFDGTVTLRPSVGNGQQGCRSHYFISKNQIDWRRRMSTAATTAAIKRDVAAHAGPRIEQTPAAAPSWWDRLKRALRWITGSRRPRGR